MNLRPAESPKATALGIALSDQHQAVWNMVAGPLRHLLFRHFGVTAGFQHPLGVAVRAAAHHAVAPDDPERST